MNVRDERGRATRHEQRLVIRRQVAAREKRRASHDSAPLAEIFRDFPRLQASRSALPFARWLGCSFLFSTDLASDLICRADGLPLSLNIVALLFRFIYFIR